MPTRATILISLSLALTLAGCNSSSSPAQPAPQIGTAFLARSVSGQTLRAFSIQAPDGRELTGYRRISPDLWSGPHPETGQVVTWSARTSDLSLTLYTEQPRITTMVIYVDTNTVASSALNGDGVLSYSEY